MNEEYNKIIQHYIFKYNDKNLNIYFTRNTELLLIIKKHEIVAKAWENMTLKELEKEYIRIENEKLEEEWEYEYAQEELKSLKEIINNLV